MNKKTDFKFIGGMVLLIAIFAVIAGGFWTNVAKQAQMVKQEEAREEAEAITAIYVETGEMLKQNFFVNMDNEMIFTASIPREGIYNKNGVLIKGDVLEVGDVVKIYGDNAMTMSIPAIYSNVTKMKRVRRADLEETDRFVKIAESAFHGAEVK